MKRAEDWIGGESFLKLLNNAVDEVCIYFGLNKYKPNFQMRSYVKFKFNGLGFSAVPTYEVIQEPIINELIHSRFRQLSLSPSVKLLIEAVDKLKDILEVNQEPEKSPQPQIPDGFKEWTVWYLLVYTLKERYSSDYYNVYGKRFISYVESYIREESIQFNIGIFVEFFDITGENFIQLSPEYSLRRLTSEERSQLCSGPESYTSNMRSSLLPSDVQCIGWKLDKYWVQKRSKHMTVDHSQHDLVMSLMRCVNPGPIFYRAVSYNFGEWNKNSAWDFTTGGQQNLNCFTTHNYSKQDIEKVKEYFERFLNYFSDDRFKLRIGLSRFNKGCLEQEQEDKLIDYVIALESILIENSGTDLKLRFSLRGASLLGKSQDERSELFKRLGDAYKFRNNLVHGSTKVDFFKVDVDTLSHIAGRAILKMIDLSNLPVKKEKILEALDSFLFSRKENESIDDFLARTLTKQ
jgi:hypothetical protein